jgi:hypothetical protein
VDEATGEPLRDESGFCIQCPPNEPGEFIGKVVRGDPVKGTIIKYTYLHQTTYTALCIYKTLLKEALHRLFIFANIKTFRATGIPRPPRKRFLKTSLVRVTCTSARGTF